MKAPDSPSLNAATGHSAEGNPVPEPTGRLRPGDWIAIFLTGLVVAASAFFCLPPSICRHDFGDVQLAAWKLGVAHPPGYPIYSLLLHPFTWLPGVDPAYAVSVGCLTAGLLALLLCVLLQIRLGLNPWIAAATVVGLSLYQRAQLNLVAPEVYGLTLLFMGLSTYLAVGFVQRGDRRRLWGSALSYCIVVISRPPLVLTAPFVLVALWVASRNAPALRRAKTWLMLAGIAAVPAVVSLGYILLRDHPNAAYNYVEDFNTERGILPQTEAGVGARLHRAVWLMSGQQFNMYVGIPLRDLPNKIVWLMGEIMPFGMAGFFIVAAIAVAGAIGVWRRSRVAGWLLTGMVIQGIVYVLCYRVHGQAADLMPLLFAWAVFVGAALSWLLGRFHRLRMQVVGFIGFALLSSFAMTEPHLCNPPFVDGAALAEELDMPTVPPGALILTEWETAAPLRYARLINDRDDVTVYTLHPTLWKKAAQQHSDRIIYVTHPFAELEPEYNMVPFRNLWRLSRRLD